LVSIVNNFFSNHTVWSGNFKNVAAISAFSGSILARIPPNSDFVVVFTDKCRCVGLFRCWAYVLASFVRPHTVGTRVLGSDSEAIVDSLYEIHVECVYAHGFEVRFLTVSESVLDVVSAIISEATY
jgi:hypothetical protein